MNQKIDIVNLNSYVAKKANHQTCYVVISAIRAIISDCNRDRIFLVTEGGHGGYDLKKDARTMDFLKKYFNFIDPTEETKK